uniref:Tyrosyl-DNA phosphodiesterase 1 n=1 Tax=Heterorhabditis bacteriophora TaxID=37862 RepID=A0A1I7XRI7_HETBA
MKRIKTVETSLSGKYGPSSTKKLKNKALTKSHMQRLVSGHMYFTKVAVLPDIFNENAFSLSDVLEIIRPILSIHFNFMIETEWLINQYPCLCRETPITLVVGEKMGTDKNNLMRDAKKWENITVLGAKLPISFGTHHTKLSIFECETKIHVIISTANLIEENSNFFLIYPCVEDVRGSIEGYSSGNSLRYQESIALRQLWLKEVMCKWRSNKMGRTHAMPHVKSYVEIVDGVPRWILLTSANLSKAAWGDLQKNGTQLMIRSYELGVLITDPAKIKLPFDYPILKYTSKDEPWIYDKSYVDPDSLDREWIVSHK